MVHADMGKRSLFPGSAAPGFSAMEPHVPRIAFGKSFGIRPGVGALILAGVLGNIVGSLVGAYAGANMGGDEDNLGPLLLSWGAGLAFGSATGVSLAGHSRYWQGSFGMAMIGGVMGSGLSFFIFLSPAFQRNGSILSLFPLLILPPVGAAILFNSSLRRGMPDAGNALINFSNDKFALGIPGIQFRPVPAPGKNAKPGLGFSVNVLSVTL